MPMAKHDCEILINAVLPFAEQMLGCYGEFHPYGAAMTVDGQITYIARYDGQQHPPAADVIEGLKEVFVAGAKKGDFKATALVYDVRVALPPNGKKSNAIAVSLNHRKCYSVVVLFPYTFENGKPVIGAAWPQPNQIGQ